MRRALLLLASLVCLGMTEAWSTSATLELLPRFADVIPSDTVTVFVEVSTESLLTGMQYAVTYDPAFMSFVDATIGADLETVGFEILNVNPAYDAEPPVCGSQCVLVQVFGGAGNSFVGSNLQAGVLRFLVTTDPCDGTPLCFNPNCSATQLVTADLETLCSSAVIFRNAAISTGCLTDVSEPSARASVVLRQNSPNPFKSSTTVEFSLPYTEWVELTVVSVRGRLVRRLLGARLPPGWHRAYWDGADSLGLRVPSGVYFCFLRSEQGVSRKRMLLLR